MASSSTGLQQQHVTPAFHPNENQREDAISSPPGLWLPATVVKRNRRAAIGIWVSLLAAFFAYVIYIVYDGIQQRRNPAASIQIKEEVFNLPDIAICTSYNLGCLLPATDCFDVSSVRWTAVNGFDESSSNYTDYEDDAEVLAIQEEYPNCLVVRTSKLEPNRSGIESGDIDYLGVRIQALWLDDPYGYAEDTGYFSQAIGLGFTDVSAGVEAFDPDTMDAYLPYSRVNISSGIAFTTTESHLVLSLTKFTGITKDGKKKDTESTFIQRATSVDSHFILSGIELGYDVAILIFTLWINKFEFSDVEEVDPVNAWAIIGAIGGVWQYVVIGFGLFFVFREKQPPEYKLRNFKKSAQKPISAARRLSSISSKASSTRDNAVEATDDDLPAGWIKMQRPDGTMYYHNTITGLTSERPPHGHGRPLDLPAPSAGLRAAHQGETGCDPLPAGWVEKPADNGRTYYMNTRERYTQWERPIQVPAPPPGGRGAVQEVDVPRASVHRNPASSDGSSSGTAGTECNVVSTANSLCSKTSPESRKTAKAERGNTTAANVELPENWQRKVTMDGKIYYANVVTKKTQWEHPTN